MNDNRRKRTRVKLGASVDVHATGARLLGLKSRDLSHKGVYVLGDLPLKPGQNCLVTVHLPLESDSAPVLQMEGKVVRPSKEGAAIDFVSMDPDTYMHLRNLILHNANDPDQAEQEFSQPAFDTDQKLS